MLYYLLFWAILGFIIHFHIIFGTNLLTGGPAQNCCFFFAYFSVSKKRNIKWSRNGTKSTGEVIFGRNATRWAWSTRQGISGLLTRVVGPPKLHRRTSCTHIYSHTLKLLEQTIDREFRHQKPPQPPKANLDPFRHPAGGRVLLRWPSSSSRCSP